MSQETQDAGAKRRIVTHMNEDHHDSVVLYLEHYCQLSHWAASKGKISDVDLNGMSLSCGDKSYRVPFDPPLKSYRETRERVVEMDKSCRSTLQRSDITVNEFVAPTGLYLITFLATASTFLAYSQRWWFARGQIVERLLGTGFADFSWTIQPWLIAAMLLIHSSELVFFIPLYLQKHNVNPRSSTWWLWAFFSFIEGQFAWSRFKKHVAKKREAKEKQKH